MSNVCEQKALSELRRVLKPDGIAFINAPVFPNLAVTLEDPRYNTYALRLKYYSQCDHVRKYGYDYIKHLEQACFHVDRVVVREHFTTRDVNRNGLCPDEEICRCRKVV